LTHGRLDVTLRPDGSFKTGLSAGANNIDLSHITTEKGLYIKSIRSGNQDVLRNGFAAAASEHVDLQVVLASDGGRIEGAVSDEDVKPITGATVVPIPNDPALRARFDFTRDAVTDQSGHFELKEPHRANTSYLHGMMSRKEAGSTRMFSKITKLRASQ
jgi:hypothetical protein